MQKIINELMTTAAR